MILHLLNQRHTSLPSLVASGDVIVLIEDGVYSRFGSKQAEVYSLDADCAARGVTPDSDHISLSYTDLVDLCARAAKVVSW